MATEKRPIYANVLQKKFEGLKEKDAHATGRNAYDLCAMLTEDAPTVDAVPVDEIKFLYCAIDKKGIPELKIQLGDRIFCLRRDNDPVNAVTVVRCKDCCWCKEYHCNYMCQHPTDGMPGDVYADDFCSYGETK